MGAKLADGAPGSDAARMLAGAPVRKCAEHFYDYFLSEEGKYFVFLCRKNLIYEHIDFSDA